MTAALTSWHHLAVLAKRLRLNYWIRSAIVFPPFAAVVLVLNVLFHTRPIFPAVVILPLIVILTSCFLRPRHEEEDPDV